MLSKQLTRTRKIPLHPFRNGQQTAGQRVFTHNAQLLLLARHTPRPQLPFLHQPALSPVRPFNGARNHISRLLSTETRRFVREQTWLAVKWTAIGWTFLILGGISYFGVRLALVENANPTPEEWKFSTRQMLRAARIRMDPKTAEETGYTDWAKIGVGLRQALKHLEDTNKEGKGLVEVADGEGILIPGVGKAGFDISAMSWPWRAGYFEVIMGCGRAAEHVDGMVLDQSRSMVFPRDVMIGPSNPDPRPVPPYMKAAPLEENCIAPSPGPETFYMRVLTGKGFTSKQKIDAALAYANWLNYKQLPESAEEMYKWAVDIAADGLPPHVKKESIVDVQTGVLKQGPEAHLVTSNLLRTSTELAIHFARNGDVTQALPVFLSALRARRQAPVLPTPQSPTLKASPIPQFGMMSFLGDLFRVPVFPPPPSSGDDPLIKTSESSCDESELMLYIGEILFATSPASSEGVGWTRQAVTSAQTNLQQLRRPADRKDDDDQKCKECLLTGVNNWEAMVQRLSEQLPQANESQRRGWFGSQKSNRDNEAKIQAFQEQLAQIADIKARIVQEGIDEKFARSSSTNPSGVWIG